MQNNQTQHTPGPWNTDPENPADIQCQSGEIATVFQKQMVGFQLVLNGNFAASSIGEATANARLIAAAPELLEALETVARLNPDAGEIGAGMLANIVSKARAAIAKAKGIQS